jgi:hypothetical protein
MTRTGSGREAARWQALMDLGHVGEEIRQERCRIDRAKKDLILATGFGSHPKREHVSIA